MASRAGHWCASLAAQQHQAWGRKAHPHILPRERLDLQGKGRRILVETGGALRHNAQQISCRCACS